MSNWITKTIFFPLGKLDETFISIYLSRYTIDTSLEQQYIDGIPVELSPVENETFLSTIYKDNYPLTRFRKASIFDGTITPTPVYDPPLEENEDPSERTPTGHTITLSWAEAFINDLTRDPQTEPGLFDGVSVL